MSNKAVEKLDQLVRARDLKLDHLRSIRSMFDKDPSLVTDLLDNLIDPNLNGAMSTDRILKGKDRRHGSHFLAILVEYFRTQDNDWRSVRQIADGCKLATGNVNYMLYTSGERDLFEGKLVSPKQKVWRLKTPPASRPPETPVPTPQQ